MTWNVNLNGHDDLSGEDKEKFEQGLVETIQSLADDLAAKDGVNVTQALVATNTTGQVNLLENNIAGEEADEGGGIHHGAIEQQP
jgi:hypothetical protein